MVQYLLKNILTEAYIKYKLNRLENIQNGFNPHQAENPGFGVMLLLPARVMFV
jgi:hypothetical protein